MIFVVIALFGSLILGSISPVFGGLIMSDVLTHLTVPIHMYQQVFPGKNMEDEISMYCLIMACTAAVAFLTMCVSKYFFFRSSELVTFNMRHTLYNSILSKNIGWFDLRDNGVGILSTAMASDT